MSTNHQSFSCSSFQCPVTFCILDAMFLGAVLSNALSLCSSLTETKFHTHIKWQQDYSSVFWSISTSSILASNSCGGSKMSVTQIRLVHHLGSTKVVIHGMRIEWFLLHPVSLNWLFCDQSTIWGLCCSYMLHEIDWQLVTDVSGQPVGSIEIRLPTYEVKHPRRVNASATLEWMPEISHCSLFCLCSFWTVQCDIQEFHSCEYWDNGVQRQERSLYPTDRGRCFLRNTLPI